MPALAGGLPSSIWLSASMYILQAGPPAKAGIGPARSARPGRPGPVGSARSAQPGPDSRPVWTPPWEAHDPNLWIDI